MDFTLEEELGLDCPVCLEQYDEGLHNPKMMQCMHTVCASCLISLVGPQKTEIAVPLENTVSLPPRILNGPAVVTTERTARDQPATLVRNNLRPPLPVRERANTLPPPAVPPKLQPRSHSFKNKYKVSIVSEPEIPKGKNINCPLCRLEINTDKLQTNRYIVTHLLHIKRLQQLQMTETENVVKEQPLLEEKFWCNDCHQPAHNNTCQMHDLTSLNAWILLHHDECQALANSLDDCIPDHIRSVSTKTNIIAIVTQTLTLASRHLQQQQSEISLLNSRLQDIRKEMEGSSKDVLSKKALHLQNTLTELQRFQDKINQFNFNSDEIFLYQQKKKLFISTKVPDQTVCVSVSEEKNKLS